MPPQDPERLFASWLARRPRIDEAEPGDLDALIAAHPEHADTLRDLHGQWRRIEELRERFGLGGSLAERLRALHGEVDPGIELEPGQTKDFTDAVVGRLSGHASRSTRYRHDGELARGGMGAVLAVWDEDLRRDLAMKVLLGGKAPGKESAGGSADRKQLARLLEEAQVTAQLDHPGIVPVHELGLDAEGEVYFTMKLVKGRTLGEVFGEFAKGEGDWTRTRVVGLLLKVCEAMTYAHAKGVIHRDLKPDNVMVGRFGEVYVMDWGLAKVLGRSDDADRRAALEPGAAVRSDRHDWSGAAPESALVTMDGDVVGTPAYMSPEQATGQVSTMGPPSDVYALGAMLYQLLAGHMPYAPPGAPADGMSIWNRVRSGPPEPLDQVAPDAPPELVAICQRAMRRAADERYADMGELAADLLAYLEGRVVAAYEGGAWAEARKWVRRNKGLAGALGAAVLLLVAGLTNSIRLQHRAEDNFDLAEVRRGQAEQLNVELEAERANLAAEVASVKRLSALQDYDDLVARVDDLWPAHPPAIPALEAWLDQARGLVATLPVHRAKRDELRAGALPRTDEERAAERAAHPDLPLLAELEGRVATARAALETRRGAAPVEPPKHYLIGTTVNLEQLNGEAWSLVAPDRQTLGREAEGLAIARTSLILATSSKDPWAIAAAGDTLAWGLFALGRDAEALDASRAALAAAAAVDREIFQDALEGLEAGVAEATSPAGLAAADAALADLTAELAQVEARVDERRTWRFPDTPEGREARWWHANVSLLIEALEGLEDPDVGLLSASPDAASAVHGWSVPRRLAFARRMQDELAPGGSWAARWDAARAAIAADPAYGGLDLPVQVGLVPLGPDPVTGLYEFWHPASGAEPGRDADGRLVASEDAGLALVLLPGGTFWMGAGQDPNGPNYDPFADEDEGPPHQVTLSPFFLSKYEATQAQWLRLTGANPSYYQPPDGRVTSLRHPVEQVSWLDARRELERTGLVLPTQSQWEYGCRAGTDTPWWTGAERQSLVDAGGVNLADQTAARGGAPWPSIGDWPELDDGYGTHAPVGSYAANPFGLFDVHGNVYEWCLDGHGQGAVRSDADVDPLTPPEGAALRFSAGGAFNSTASIARATPRNFAAPERTASALGLRPARWIERAER